MSFKTPLFDALEAANATSVDGAAAINCVLTDGGDGPAVVTLENHSKVEFDAQEIQVDAAGAATAKDRRGRAHRLIFVMLSPLTADYIQQRLQYADMREMHSATLH